MPYGLSTVFEWRSNIDLDTYMLKLNVYFAQIGKENHTKHCTI